MKILLLSIIISSCLWRISNQNQNNDCINQCGNITIPYPFGIGPTHCYLDTNFAVSCNSSSTLQSIPFLKTLGLEILQIRVYSNKGPWGTITVKIPSTTACNHNSNTDAKVTWTSNNLTDSFRFSVTENVFASMGCDGYALFYNETGGIIAGCTSVCSLIPPEAIVRSRTSISRCYGYHCCQQQVASKLTYRYFPHRGIKQYSISVSTNTTSKNCRSAFLISSQYLEAKAPFSPWITFVPVVLEWGFLSYSVPFALYGILVTTIAIAIGTSFIICGCCWRRWRNKNKRKRKEIKLREKYFKDKLEENGSSSRENVEKTKLFTVSELKRFTDNFNNDRVLGKGAQGTVYKGMLKDGQVIAVKRSKALDSSQWKEFINEVILLSQIKHRHVVKILGCCLEDDIPLVVYEFICNGTLSEHIHKSIDELLFTWEMRLRIAFETATAIVYLHSEFTTPIYHRDIKSSNILLDDKFGAKLSDFGISRAVSVEQTHLTTCVQGTFGYLDPEYFNSGQYSEKSDVYSFGVIMAELLTGQKPIRATRVVVQGEEESEDEEERSLAMYFMSSINNETLFKIVDPMILGSGKKEDVMRFANLAKQCLNPTGLERPTMKEVTMVLDRLRRQNSSSCMLLKQTNEVGDRTIGSSSMITSSMETDNGI